MHIQYSRWDRAHQTSREELGSAALRWCRALRGSNTKVHSARYLWVDPNTIVTIVEGEPGFADFNQDVPEELLRAQFALNDVARRVTHELWTDARVGQQRYEQAGRPTGINTDECRACDGLGQLSTTDVGDGGAFVACRVCNGTGRRGATATPAAASAST